MEFGSSKDFIKKYIKVREKKDCKTKFRRSLYAYMYVISMLFLAVFVALLIFGICWIIWNLIN